MIRVGVIGYGYWGPNLVRNFVESQRSEVVSVCDLREGRLQEAHRRHPSIKVTSDFRELINDKTIDAVAIATSVSSHFTLANQALDAGKHVVVEKPLASSAEQCMVLIDKAASSNLTLMVDHTFVFTSAVRKIREMIRNGVLGNIYYYDSMRVNLGLFQHDVSVIWDLAVHDLAILDYVLEQRPTAVSTTGINNIDGQPPNVAYMTLFFPGREIAHIHVNWLAPVKVRRTLIGGSEKMIVYDDLEPSEKLKVYDKGISIEPRTEEVYQLLVSYRSGDMWAPRLDTAEALRVEVEHFVDCVETGATPHTDGHAGLRIVRLLEAAELSMSKRGELMELPC